MPKVAQGSPIVRENWASSLMTNDTRLAINNKIFFDKEYGATDILFLKENLI